MDPMWEFNAPQFVDFNNVNEDPKADAYFDMDHEADVLAEPDDISSTNCDINTANSTEKSDLNKEEATAIVESSTGCSVVMSEAELSDVDEDEVGELSPQQESVSSAVRCSVRRSRSSVGTPSAQSEAGSGKRTGTRRSVRRSVSSSGKSVSMESSAGRRGVGQSGGKRPSLSRMNKVNAKLTLPATPSWMKRYNAVGKSKQIKNSESLEMEKIQELRKALVQKRKIAAESCAKALQAVRCPPVVVGQPLTNVQEFHFATDARVKDGVPGKQTAGWKEVDFTKELRKTSATVSTGAPAKTIPQPFNLHSPKKRKSSSDDKFETVAEKVAKFYSKTPDRYHSRRAGSLDRSPVGRRSCSADRNVRVVPKTPNLITRARARPTTVTSQAELEQREIEDMKKNQFKARPVNEKILKQGFEIVKNSHKTHKMEEFHLETEDRLCSRKDREEKSHDVKNEEPVYEFHARPVPTAILAGPVGVKPMKELPLTVPQSPAFATKYTLRSTRPEKPPTPKEKRIIKANAIPHTGLPFQPKFEQRVTTVAPFSFDSKIQRSRLKKEEKIKECLEEEKKAREFHATELKDLDPVLPPRRVKPATALEPFQFEAERRAALKELHLQQKIQQEIQQQKEMANFKAKPADILKKAPYEPVKAARQATELAPFKLSTERRAEERQRWERLNEEKEAEAAAERMERERREAEQEENERRRLRSEAVHHAQPIRAYKPVHIQASDKPLTVPETPAFSERLRSRNSAQQ